MQRRNNNNVYLNLKNTNVRTSIIIMVMDCRGLLFNTELDCKPAQGCDPSHGLSRRFSTSAIYYMKGDSCSDVPMEF